MLSKDEEKAQREIIAVAKKELKTANRMDRKVQLRSQIVNAQNNIKHGKIIK